MSADDEQQQAQEPQETREQQQQQQPGRTKGRKVETRSSAGTQALDATTMRGHKGQDLKRRVRNAKFSGSIHKRGSKEVSGLKVEEDGKPVVSPLALAILIFVVCGSAIFGVAQTLMSR